MKSNTKLMWEMNRKDGDHLYSLYSSGRYAECSAYLRSQCPSPDRELDLETLSILLKRQVWRSGLGVGGIFPPQSKGDENNREKAVAALAKKAREHFRVLSDRYLGRRAGDIAPRGDILCHLLASSCLASWCSLSSSGASECEEDSEALLRRLSVCYSLVEGEAASTRSVEELVVRLRASIDCQSCLYWLDYLNASRAVQALIAGSCGSSPDLSSCPPSYLVRALEALFNPDPLDGGYTSRAMAYLDESLALNSAFEPSRKLKLVLKCYEALSASGGGPSSLPSELSKCAPSCPHMSHLLGCLLWHFGDTRGAVDAFKEALRASEDQIKRNASGESPERGNGSLLEAIVLQNLYSAYNLSFCYSFFGMYSPAVELNLYVLRELRKVQSASRRVDGGMGEPRGCGYLYLSREPRVRISSILPQFQVEPEGLLQRILKDSMRGRDFKTALAAAEEIGATARKSKWFALLEMGKFADVRRDLERERELGRGDGFVNDCYEADVAASCGQDSKAILNLARNARMKYEALLAQDEGARREGRGRKTLSSLINNEACALVMNGQCKEAAALLEGEAKFGSCNFTIIFNLAVLYLKNNSMLASVKLWLKVRGLDGLWESERSKSRKAEVLKNAREEAISIFTLLQAEKDGKGGFPSGSEREITVVSSSTRVSDCQVATMDIIVLKYAIQYIRSC